MNERDVTRDTENGRDPARLERDIDRTRASLGRTVDALERRLSPGELVDQALGMAREHGGEFASNLGRSVRNNPMPVILTGVGLAWMMASSNEPRAPAYRSTGYGGYDDEDWTSESVGEAGSEPGGRLKSGVSSAKSALGSMGEKASRAKDSLKHSVGSLGDSASGAVRSTGDRMRTQGDRMRMQSLRLRSNLETLMEEQPLIVGAIGIAIGAALGAAFPRTESEDRLLGKTRDSAMRAAKERAAEVYEDVKDTAADVVSSARSKGSDSQHEPDQPSGSASPMGGSNGTRGQESRRESGDRPQGSPEI